MEAEHKYLDAETLNKISRLDLKARMVVEGFVAGLHRSPYHGFSVEFAEHREYVPGDDLKHLDWKVYGRSDRLYLKQYEQETNLRSFLLLDTSESMKYKSGEHSKLEYACYMVASLAYLVLRQQDAVGLVLFDQEVSQFIPSSSNPANFRLILTDLVTLAPKKKTDLGRILNEVAERISHRGLVMIFSDLLDEPQRILKGLSHFRYRKHDVIVFHILDSDEVRFPFQRMSRFEGLEGFPHLVADPRALRREYLTQVNGFITQLRRGCLEQRIDYVQVTTDQPVDVALSTYLASRMGRRGR